MTKAPTLCRLETCEQLWRAWAVSIAQNGLWMYIMPIYIHLLPLKFKAGKPTPS